MRGRWLVSLTIASAVLAALSGCVEEGATKDVGTLPDAAASSAGGGSTGNFTPLTQLEVEFNATGDQGPSSTSDWFLMSLASGPSQPLAGFRWRVPEGAVVPDESERLGGGDGTSVVIEAVPFLSKPSANFVQWILLAFVVEDGSAVPWFTFHRGPAKWIDHYATSEGGGDYVVPLNSQVFELVDDVPAGSEVLLVLGAESEAPAEFGVAFRALTRNPELDESFQPSADLAALRDNLTDDRPPRALERLGTGAGFLVPYYGWYKGCCYQDPSTGAPGPYAYEQWNRGTETVEVLPSMNRHYVTARDVIVMYESPTVEAGWGFGYVFYLGVGSAGAWDVEADVHGRMNQMNGQIYPGAPYLPCFVQELRPLCSSSGAYYDLTGLPYYYMEHEGPGGSSVSFHLTYEEGTILDLVELWHLDTGAPLKTLIGMPGRSIVETDAGFSPSPMRLSVQHGQLVRESMDGPTIMGPSVPAGLATLLSH